MIIYDILLILQYQVSSTVMDLIVVFCIVSFLYLCSRTLWGRSRKIHENSTRSYKYMYVYCVCFLPGHLLCMISVCLSVRPSVRHTSMLCRNA